MAQITFHVPHSADNYIFIPACCYHGNQFAVRAYNYPPMFRPEEASPDMPVTITDVPRLNPDGSGKIEVTTGDAAVPCVGVYLPDEKRGILIFTVQEIGGKNIGLAYEQGEIRLTWPAKREKLYYGSHLHSNPQVWTDEPADIPTKVLDFACEDLEQFFRTYFENRKIMGLDDRRPEPLPFSRQLAMQRRKFNTMNWHEDPGFYMVGTDRSHFQVWQPGWTGGGMSSYALMKLGDETEQQRALDTLSFLFSTQAESGFFAGIVDDGGNVFGDGFDVPGTENWHLLRKSADVLYFLFKHFALMQERGLEIPTAWLDGTRKTADGFVRLWEKYGQLGQFVDLHTGDICVGGSASAAIASAGLAEASVFFGEEKYLRTAEAIADWHDKEQLCKGYTTGGPGEMLQCVDSESAFGLLESFVTLYEVTKNTHWLNRARVCADFCSSWVVAYNYRFPEKSEFGRLNKKTVGSVFANLQNKHAAPGICTLSGDSLFKLWKYTGDRLYLELLKDISLTIGQYLSTDENPIYGGLTPTARENATPEELEAHRMPEGFICERVNLSDWEGQDMVGGLFNGSCWCETSNLLTLAEVIPLLQEAGELN